MLRELRVVKQCSSCASPGPARAAGAAGNAGWQSGAHASAEVAVLLAAAQDDAGLAAQSSCPLMTGIWNASNSWRNIQLCAEAWYRGASGYRGTAAHFVSVMPNRASTRLRSPRLARHFSVRTTETTGRHEPRTAITTGTDVMDRICGQPGAPCRCITGPARSVSEV